MRSYRYNTAYFIKKKFYPLFCIGTKCGLLLSGKDINYKSRKVSGLENICDFKDEVREQYQILHNEGFCDFYRSRSIVRIVRYGRLLRTVHVARMGRQEMHKKIWWVTSWKTERSIKG
jgi:hypothetical protein